MRVKRIGIVLMIALIVGCAALEVSAQTTNPCKAASIQMLSSSTYRFVVESPFHGATSPMEPSKFIITTYRNKWVEDLPPQNPLARPTVHVANVPRAQMTLVPDTPDCYISPVITISDTVPAMKNLRSFVVGTVNAPNEIESFASEVTDPFVLARLRFGAHRIPGQ